MIRFILTSKITLSCVAGVANCMTPCTQIIDHCWHASSSSRVLYPWPGAKRLMAQSYNPGKPSWYLSTLGDPCVWENSTYKNLLCKASRLKCCLYETPYYVAAPSEKQVMSSRTYKDQIFFLGSQVTRSSETHLKSVLAPTSFFFKEATCKSSTINGLLYALEAP
jgi:hypothetical protein